MPDIDGFGALRLIDTFTPETPVLVVSGTVGEEATVALLKAGAVDYVLKDGRTRLISSIERALRDVGERRARRIAEQNVHETELRFRQLAEASNDIFWFADMSPFRIRYVSPAVENIWGHKPDAFYTDPDLWLTGVHAEDRPRVQQNFNAWLAGERLSFVEEFRVVRGDGSIRWVHDTGIFNVDPSGLVKRMSGVARDITQTKEAAEHRLRAQRLESVGLLAGSIAHDLNNALTPILIGLELMRPDLPPEMAELYGQMHLSASRGAMMVRQLLAFTRGAGGQNAVVEPQRAIREIEQLASTTFPKDITTSVTCADDVPMVEIDPTALYQALLNLCVNARDAMPRGGRLRVQVESKYIDESYAGFFRDAKPGTYVVFIVSDTGSGIASDVLPKIFDPFFTTKPAGVGTGLGLTTVAGIAHNHGGFVQVASELGKGTTFKMYFPASSKATPPPPGPAGPAPDCQGGGTGVLVVDDQESVRALLKSLLERRGFRVFSASDGTEALAIFAGHRSQIGLAMTDVRMPHLDGTALVRTLRHMEPHLPVIAMSGLHDDSRSKEFAAAGVQVLQKPFTMPDLIRALQACLAPLTVR